MKKWRFIITVLILLWLISFGASKLSENFKTIADNQIAIIPVSGVIGPTPITVPFTTSSANIELILKSIEKAKEDKIKAVIFEINSPGGTVVASREIANAIKNLEKPTIALIREIGTSGAYWVASSADFIIADELSITGSLGVVASYLEFSDLLQKYGIDYERLVSGEYKDLGSPFKDLSSKERKLLQEKLDKIHDYFIKEVKENRNLSDTMEIESGIFYLGVEAKELGLVDELGNKELAVEKAKELANISKARLVEFKEKKGLLDLIGRVSAYSFYYMGKGIGSKIYLDTNSKSLEILAK